MQSPNDIIGTWRTISILLLKKLSLDVNVVTIVVADQNSMHIFFLIHFQEKVNICVFLTLIHLCKKSFPSNE